MSIEAVKRLKVTAASRVIPTKFTPANFAAKEMERVNDFQARADYARARIPGQLKLIKAVASMLAQYEAAPVVYEDSAGYPWKPAWSMSGTEAEARAVIGGLGKLGFKFLNNQIDYALQKQTPVRGDYLKMEGVSIFVKFFSKKNTVVVFFSINNNAPGQGPARL